jgi:hypothetical protein
VAFIQRLLQRPELVKHFVHVNVKGWKALDGLQLEHYESHCNIAPSTEIERGKKVPEFDRFRDPEPTKEEYLQYVELPKMMGIIVEVFLYAIESAIIKKARLMLSANMGLFTP